jgi:hypothetical membrane protein
VDGTDSDSEAFDLSSVNSAWLKVSGVCGIVTPIVAFTCITIAIANYPPFSWTDNALSDLGIQSGIVAPSFNAGLIAGGLLGLAFATGLFHYLQEGALGMFGALLFVVDTLALVAIGVFPENVKPNHYYASVAFFLLYPVSMFVIVVASFLAGRKKLGLFTLAAALFAAATWIFHWLVGFGSNVAIPELLSALAASAWSVVVGFKMLKAASRSIGLPRTGVSV